jgi:hypothetical protein
MVNNRFRLVSLVRVPLTIVVGWTCFVLAHLFGETSLVTLLLLAVARVLPQ